MANYKINDAKMFADITDGIAIVINSDTGVYYGANTLGTVVIDQLIKGASVEAVAAALKALPGCPTDIDARLAEFVGDMLAKELIVAAADQSTAATVEAAAVKDGWQMKVTEFTDAQELLLADPIHEVKEDTGWAPETSALNPDPEDVKRREAKRL